MFSHVTAGSNDMAKSKAFYDGVTKPLGLVMLVFGLINWLANKVKEGKAAPPPRPIARPPQARETAPQTGNAEAERMRRFLEALGVPADATAAAPVRPPAANRAFARSRD